MPIKIECVLACDNHLGEGPVWDVEEGRLYWVDGTGRRVGKPSLWRMEPKSGKVESWSLDRDIGALALRKNGGAVMALDDGFYFYDYDKEKLELITLIDADNPRTRLNDGKVDRRGRFFAGGMDDKEELKNCAIWRLDPDLSVTKVDEGIICSNGPCWSPDDKTFYFADTFQREYWAYDYDLAKGTLSNKRIFADLKKRTRRRRWLNGRCRRLPVERPTDRRRPGALRARRQRGAPHRHAGTQYHQRHVRRRQSGRDLRHLDGARQTSGGARTVRQAGQAAIPGRWIVPHHGSGNQGHP